MDFLYCNGPSEQRHNTIPVECTHWEHQMLLMYTSTLDHLRPEQYGRCGQEKFLPLSKYFFKECILSTGIVSLYKSIPVFSWWKNNGLWIMNWCWIHHDIWPLYNSLRPSDAYMRHQPRPSLVQIKACRKAIIWTNAVLLSIGPLGTNFSQVVLEIQIFSFKKMHWKMSGKCQSFCLSLNVINQ